MANWNEVIEEIRQDLGSDPEGVYKILSCRVELETGTDWLETLIGVFTSIQTQNNRIQGTPILETLRVKPADDLKDDMLGLHVAVAVKI